MVSKLYKVEKFSSHKKGAKDLIKVTDAMMISRPAPEEPPMMETIRLGVIAMHRVIRFLNHFVILMSKNPWLNYHGSNSLPCYTNIYFM